MSPLIPTITCVAGLFVLLYAEGAKQSTLRAVAKTVASLSFVAVAYLNGAMDSQAGLWMLLAFGLCLVGDVFLLFVAAPLFVLGMLAFALGHGAFAWSFSLQGGTWDNYGLTAAAAMGLLSLVMLAFMWKGMGALRVPVIGYMIIITVMVALGVSAGMGMAPYAIAAGAVAFAVSDIAVAIDRFAADSFVNKLWGLPLYYGAQLLLAHSV